MIYKLYSLATKALCNQRAIPQKDRLRMET